MKRRVRFTLMCALSVISLLMPTVAAKADSSRSSSYRPDDMLIPPKTWQITMRGRTVANLGDRLAVKLNTPQNLALEDGDEAGELQTLDLTAATVAVDAKGAQIPLGAVLPGQDVRVTFRFYWQNSSPRTLVTADCNKIELVGETQQRKSTAAPADFGNEVLVGTVVSVKGRRLEVYVESGHAKCGEDVFYVQGLQRADIPQSAQITGSDGTRMILSEIEPFDRVVLQELTCEWMLSYPPQFLLTGAAKIQVLDQGEKLFNAESLIGRSGLENDRTGEITAVTGNPTADELYAKDKTADFFIFNDLVCLNAGSIDWVQKLSLTKDVKLGEINATGKTAGWQGWNATKLPKGAKIYACKGRQDILLAESGGKLIPYLKMAEG